jgi:hypothetical protein
VVSTNFQPLYLWEILGTHLKGGWLPHFWKIKTNFNTCVRIMTPKVQFISRIIIIMCVAKTRTAAEGLC